MKRLALLSFAAMMLAATAFAPVAMAETGDVEIQSVFAGESEGRKIAPRSMHRSLAATHRAAVLRHIVNHQGA